MESIKYQVKGHSVEFSKRALTIDNKVYSYTGISQIKHSSAYHAYLFKYNGEWVKLFYEDPESWPEIPAKYGVDYIYLSSYERNSYEVDEEALAELYPIVFENDEAVIFKVPEG